METFKSLAEIVRKVSVCNRCSLHQGRTHAVPGEGSSSAEIMFVGEGPGHNEDQQGRPFCGAAGQLLDELLASIGLKRTEVYIANVVKCRPPGNRDPKPEEVDACFPYLLAQINLLKPKIIACLGRHSLAKFLPEMGTISQLHGRAFAPRGENSKFEIPNSKQSTLNTVISSEARDPAKSSEDDGISPPRPRGRNDNAAICDPTSPFGLRGAGARYAIMALYHPAVGLYKDSMKQVLFEDFKKLKILLSKIK